MGRQPMPIGTAGTIRHTRTSTGWRAKVRYRGHDGVIRDLSRSGKTKAAADRALKLALAQALQTTSGGEFTARSRFREVAAPWLARQERRAEAGERAAGTIDNYRSILNNRVLPALGELQLFEVTTGRLNKFLAAVKEETSAAHARTARAVVGGILRYAINSSGALATNPIRDVDPIEGGPAQRVRALTREERRTWLAQLELDPKAVRHDLPDLTRFMLATGVRIGEALALYWEDVTLPDGEAGGLGLARFEWTVVRLRGVGLVRTDPKTPASERTIPLTSWAVDLLRRRRRVALAEGRSPASPVFPDSLGGLRDPSNTRRSLRECRGSEGFSWVKSHVYRKTAGTVLDEAGYSPRQIADFLGHARPSVTLDRYVGRGAVAPTIADAMEDLL
ncbi:MULTISPECIES: site-specific integrase [unclassified Amycolatopsis]|uniref:site-specific integrase n=1 Tax=unclassified Amycolatopsis TaxID=2618356 RepID=UPI002875D0B9|nr:MULTISPECIES: site-specific integrase [unclassified Amycolatopsis]MDS0137578.1 site-specific integrase [Amycolatopsis sp. 505]MDS0141773.1 site-specific integrase [Amycolatopsis sp. CM201R]